MSIDIALADARNNCVRDGAKCTVILRSGVRVVGRLKNTDPSTAHFETIGGGWATVDRDEIVVVESHR